jgi:hypothetical protein
MGRRSLPIVPGMRFGRLTVIKRVKPGRQRNIMWECRCDDGNLVQVRASHLYRGKIQSCGCLGRELSRECGLKRFAEDLTGQKFGRLTIIGRAKSGPTGHARYECRCDCGNIIQTRITALRSGNTKSCGCLQREQSAHRAAVLSYRHGA